MHFYPFNIGDYSVDTAHLDDLEDLAYRRLMDLYYSTEEPIPLDISEVSKKIRMRSHSELIASVLKEFFTEEEDGFHNERIDVEIFKFKEKSYKASKSAKERWKKHKVKQKLKASCERIPNAKQTQSEGNAKQELRTKNQEPINNNKDIGQNTLSAKANEPYEIFKYWVDTMKKGGGTKFSSERMKKVKDRLKDGYETNDIKFAIYGCSITPHNNGTDPKGNGQKYDDLELICRNATKLERFIETGKNGINIPSQQSLGSGGGDWFDPDKNNLIQG